MTDIIEDAEQKQAPVLLVPRSTDYPKISRANVLGVRVHAISMRMAVQVLDSAIAAGNKGYVCVTGVHGVIEAQKDPTFKAVLNRCLLTTPDGMPMVWVGRAQGHAHMGRVCGPDLLPAVCAMSSKKGYTQFFYGGAEGVAQELERVLTRRFPELKIVGTYTPPFRPLSGEEEAELVHLVATVKPHIFWVGLSTPKQERFMAEYIQKLDTRVMVGVGAAFDFHTGKIQDSPDWIKNAGLQWLHRLYQEPTRLWKRYLVNNPQFLAKITLQFLGLKDYGTL